MCQMILANNDSNWWLPFPEIWQWRKWKQTKKGFILKEQHYTWHCLACSFFEKLQPLHHSYQMSTEQINLRQSLTLVEFTFFLCASRGFILQPRLWNKCYTDKTLCVDIGCCVRIKYLHWHFTPEKLIDFVWHDRLIIHSCFCTTAYTFKRNLILRERESNEVHNWGFIPQRKDEFDPKPNETGVESYGISNPG